MTTVMSPTPATATGGMQTSSTAPAPSTHPYTCNTCQVAFRSSEGQRNHMHTDWHRYNLKRRITELPPISSESFAEKVLSSQATSRLEQERASFEKVCQPCGKTYYSENAFVNHISSGKHKTRVSALGKLAFRDGDGTESVMSSTFSMGEPDEDLDDVDDDEDNDEIRASHFAAADELSSIVKNLKVAETKDTAASSTTGDSSTPRVETPTSKDETEATDKGLPSLPVTECLFCTTNSETIEKNVEHMKGIHGLFVPEQRYLVNLEGLIKYLGQKILVGNTCLYCNKAKGGLDGIRTHMRDKNHCKIAFESEEEMLEVGEFYDFRSTYDGDADEDWEDEGPSNTKGEGEDWETDSDDDSVSSEELGSVPVDQVRPAHTKRNSHHLEDGWHSHAHSHAHTHAVYHTDYELHLPTGRTVGHRSLARYYRQNLHNSSMGATENQRQIEYQPEGVRGRAGALVTRENGGSGLASAPLAVRKQASKLEKKDRKVAERGRERMQAYIEKKGNSQKHYRDPLLQ